VAEERGNVYGFKIWVKLIGLGKAFYFDHFALEVLIENFNIKTVDLVQKNFMKTFLPGSY